MKTSKIIEFVGLPGSGKTTTAYALAAELKKRGYVVKTNNDFWTEVQNLNKLRRLSLYLFSLHTLSFFVRATFNILRGKVKVNQTDNKYQTRNIFGPMKDIILRDYIFLNTWQEVDYIILDEGSVYVTTDLVWKYGLPFGVIRTLLFACRYLQQAELFLFELDVDLAVQRTGERNNGSFIDNLTYDGRRKELSSAVNYYQQTYIALQQSEILDVNVINPRENLNVRIDRLVAILM